MCEAERVNHAMARPVWRALHARRLVASDVGARRGVMIWPVSRYCDVSKGRRFLFGEMPAKCLLLL